MNIPDIPPTAAQHAKAPDTAAKTLADKRAREAASRAIEAATRAKGQAKSSGKK